MGIEIFRYASCFSNCATPVSFLHSPWNIFARFFLLASLSKHDISIRVTASLFLMKLFNQNPTISRCQTLFPIRRHECYFTCFLYSIIDINRVKILTSYLPSVSFIVSLYPSDRNFDQNEKQRLFLFLFPKVQKKVSIKIDQLWNTYIYKHNLYFLVSIHQYLG